VKFVKWPPLWLPTICGQLKPPGKKSSCCMMGKFICLQLHKSSSTLQTRWSTTL